MEILKKFTNLENEASAFGFKWEAEWIFSLQLQNLDKFH